MDEKVYIKKETVWLEGTPSTSFDKHERASEIIHMKEETKSELAEPEQTQVNTFEHLADVNDEMNPCSEEGEEEEEEDEDNVKNVAELIKGSVYSCDSCCKSFKTRRILKRHILIHNEKRPFSCTMCDKTFVTNYSLKGHLLSHSGERPFQSRSVLVIDNASYHTKEADLAPTSSSRKVTTSWLVNRNIHAVRRCTNTSFMSLSNCTRRHIKPTS
ncbi:zinc finger protein 740-like [Anabrus simplex]|uniref:zinc finger protein 740-like n=1 Tax=Anabrus simplex TaxID=316456 RepID=UPI0035A30F5B